MSKVISQSESAFAVENRMRPSFVLFWLFQASRGSNFLIGVILCYALLVVWLALKKKKKVRISQFSVVFLMMCVLVFFSAQFSMPISANYIASSVFFLAIAVMLNELEGEVVTRGAIWPRRVMWFLGLFYIVTCFFAFFLNNDFLYSYFFLMEDGYISYYPNGYPRFYTVVALTFLLIPARNFLKIISFVVTSLPASIPTSIIWLLMHFRASYLISGLIISVLGVIAFFGLEELTKPIRLFFELKGLSVDGRIDKISFVALFGNPVGFDDDFSETIWVAIAQTVGLFLTAVFSVLFFCYTYKISKSWKFLLAALLLTSLNPFPLALIVLSAPLWNKSLEERSYESAT